MYRLQLKASRDVRQGVFSRKESGDGEDGAVEQHLPQFEVNPVPEKKPFKRAEGQNVGEREETRLGGYYLATQVQQNDPWGEYKHSEDCGDGPRRRFLVWAEGVFFSGRGWKDVSSGWMDPVAECGTTRLKRWIERGE